MQQEERLQTLEVEVKVLKEEVAKNVSLDPESKKILIRLLSLTSFVTKAFDYGKVIGTLVLSLIGGWMLIEKFITGIIK